MELPPLAGGFFIAAARCSEARFVKFSEYHLEIRKSPKFQV